MKKLALSLVACMICVQSAYGLTSNLETSIIIANTIIESLNTSFPGVIPQNEFIVGIEKKRKRDIDFVRARDERWIIKTVETRDRALLADVNAEIDFDNFDADVSSTDALLRQKRTKVQAYEAKVRVTPNPAIGPPSVQVLSFKRA